MKCKKLEAHAGGLALSGLLLQQKQPFSLKVECVQLQDETFACNLTDVMLH